MIRFLSALLLIFFLMSCSSDSDDMEDRLLGPETEMAEAEVEKGEFVSVAHPTSGTVSISEDRMILMLNNFKTDTGPKLNVYLSSDINANWFVDLGELKGIEGDFDYDIPEDTDLETYKYVVIWCVDFSVSFGHAELDL